MNAVGPKGRNRLLPGTPVDQTGPWVDQTGPWVDFKGENARITAKARRAMGHKVVLLDPFKVVTQTPDSFNPLDFIEANSPNALDECRDLAESLVVRTGSDQDPHWNDSSEVNIAEFAQPSSSSLTPVTSRCKPCATCLRAKKSVKRS